jgi:hypothetical protein
VQEKINSQQEATMNSRQMMDDIRKHVKQSERNAFSPDNLGGDRYCAGAMRGAHLSFRLAKAVPGPYRLILELTRLRHKVEMWVPSQSESRHKNYGTGLLYSIDQILHIVQSYAYALPTLRGNSSTPYADIRGRS